MPENEYPKLRNGLEALPIEHAGQKMILLRDRIGYAAEHLVLSPQVIPLLASMNGGNSFRDLQAEFMRQTGQLLYTETLDQLVRTLDESLFLDNERFRSFAAAQVAAFLENPVRQMYHAGRSYPRDPEKLRDQLTSFFRPENGGPGFPDGSKPRAKKMLGLVAPHIDLQAGGACFAHAYGAAAESLRPDTWIVLGTGHDPVENCFALTGKSFETPLGVIDCDREICAELFRAAQRDIRASEYNHRIEHTIEFQAVFLAFTQSRARIVPVLCSFAEESWESCREYADDFARAIGELVLDGKRSVGILASVDLAHVGPRYGDPFLPGQATVREHLASDRSLLNALEGCRAAEFIDRINRDGNSRKICGAAPLYVLSKALEGRAEGTTLCHAHAVVDERNSFVTFASMAFHEKSET